MSGGPRLSRLAWPIGAGALTASAAFAAVASSPLRGSRELGVWGATSVLASALCALPWLASRPPALDRWPPWLARVLALRIAWPPRRMVWPLVATAVLTALGVVGVRRLGFQADPAQLGALRLVALRAGLVAAVVLYLGLGAVELVAVALLPLGAGVLWTLGAMGWLGLPLDAANGMVVVFIAGVALQVSVAQVGSRLDEWRGHPRAPASAITLVSLAALALLVGLYPALPAPGAILLPALACILLPTFFLTPLLADLLLFAPPPRCGPRWWHLLGTLWSGAQLVGLQLFLFGFWAHVVSRDRLRRTTRALAHAVVTRFPFGRLELHDLAAERFERPAILVSNHQSAVDVLIIKGLPCDLRMTLKKRVWDTPTLGFGARLCGDLLVEPSRPARTLARCREELARGASVHFFPEGTRSLTGDLERFHLGAFQLAIELGQDLLPIVLCDTNTAMPRDAYWFEPYHAAVRGLPRVTPGDFDHARGPRALAEHCATLMRAALQAELERLNTPRVLRRKVARLYRYQGRRIAWRIARTMRRDPLYAALDALVPRRGLILDLACGYGLAAHWLAATALDRKLIGIDADPARIRVARRTAIAHERIHFEQADPLVRDYPACDAVLMCDVLGERTADEQQRLLVKARQALQAGGQLVVRESAAAVDWPTALARAGFDRVEVRPAGRAKSVIVTASAAALRSVSARSR